MKNPLLTAFKILPQVLRPDSARPLFLICFVTNDCNYRCKHCFIDDLSTNLEKQMTVEEWGLVAKQMKGPEILLFTGGEPFLRPDFWMIANEFYRRVAPALLLIASNGSHPDRLKDQLEKILPVCRNSKVTVGISLDGHQPVHDDIRKKKGAWESAKKSIEVVNELKKTYSNLSLNINTTFCHNNQHHIKKFLSDAHRELKPDGMSLSLIRSKPGEISEVDHALYEESQEFIHRHSFFGGKAFFSFFERTLSRAKAKSITQSKLENRRFAPCLAGRLIGVIKHDGNVHPCETRSDLLGNLRTAGYSFDRLWFSKRKRDFVQDVEASKCHCTHECFTSTNITFNPKVWPKALKEGLT